MFSFGYFPGVWGLKADVSEHSICSIFLGRWRKNIYKYMINASEQQLAIWEIWRVSDNVITWMQVPPLMTVFHLSEKQGEETDWAFTEKNTGFVLQCNPGREHSRTNSRDK